MKHWLVAALALSACAGAPRAPVAAVPAPAETIAWSVGPCFGFCPIYSASVAPSGAVTFTGERHTAVLGQRVREGGPAAYRAAAAALAPFRPAEGSAPEPCEVRISDQPHVRISWTAPDGRVTVLEHDRGCRSPQGSALNAVLDRLPEQIGIADWAHQLTRPGASRG